MNERLIEYYVRPLLLRIDCEIAKRQLKLEIGYDNKQHGDRNREIAFVQ